ncbi:hypothetical protein D3C87_629260 [compost metagenome]|jgi:hypothetical protein
MVISIVIILVVYVAIQTWSVINLSPSLLWNRAKYKKFAELQEKLQWDNFLMYRVTHVVTMVLGVSLKGIFFLFHENKKQGMYIIKNIGN